MHHGRSTGADPAVSYGAGLVTGRKKGVADGLTQRRRATASGASDRARSRRTWC